jgi:hypothetical protein
MLLLSVHAPSASIQAAPSPCLPESIAHPFPPFEDPSASGMQVLGDGTSVYLWAPVSDLFLANQTLDEIDSWMKRESFNAAKAFKWYEHDQLGNCPDPGNFCICMNGRLGPYPIVSLLIPAQWQRLFQRITKDFEEHGDTRHIKGFFGRLVFMSKNLEASAFPDVTPLMLAMVDAAADGQSTCQVEMRHAHQYVRFGEHYDRDRVIQRVRERIKSIQDTDAALAILVLIRSVGLDTQITERDVLKDFVHYEDDEKPVHPGSGTTQRL